MAGTQSATELLADRYEVGPVVGRGGMGEVRRAHDTRLRRDVAIKFLRPDLAAQSEVRTRFEAEARNAGRLTHPNVVTVFDSGERDGQPFIVMECLPGRSLRDEIDKGPLPESFARVVAADVLAGLKAAHEAGIVHRDVAPSNILLTDDGRAKIADFGIAKAGEAMSTTMAGQVVGTPAYLSPARLQGASASPADDIYAMGVVLYEAVTGQRLYTGPSSVAVAQTVLQNPPTPLAEVRPDLSPSFAAAVDGALARDPQRRLVSADEMLAALNGPDTDVTSVIETDATEVTSTMPAVAPMVAQRPPLFARLRRTPRDVWLGAAAMVGIGLLLLAFDNRGERPANAVATNPSVAPTTAPVPTTFARTATTRVQVVSNLISERHGKDEPKPKGGKGKH